nr:hypothetical protein [Tanacetum cinerariifolium]
FIELCCGWKLFGQNASRMLENNREQVQSLPITRALLLDKKNQSSALAQSSTPAPVKPIEPEPRPEYAEPVPERPKSIPKSAKSNGRFDGYGVQAC